jgi:choline dehydrogenase-like flavoprotein
MIEDANRITAGATLEADLCIVGAGAAGITLALALLDSGLDIVLLESGDHAGDAATQQLYEGTVADAHLHPPADHYRVRRFGGSTTLWGGRCMPFDEIDFEPRDYIPHSGWPIRLDHLQPYYPRANQLCEAGEFAYRAESVPGMRPMIEGFEGAQFSTDTLERFSRPTDFGKQYGPQLEQAAIRVIRHANLYSLPHDSERECIGPIEVRTLSGNHFFVNARAVVLATGGLEVARLLLASPGRSGRGVGNQYDVVGRYYMSHIAGTIGTVDLSAARGVWHGYERSAEQIYCRRRFALRPQAQRQLGIGNFIARLHHPRIPFPGHGNGILSALYLARPIIPREYRKRLDGDVPFSAATALAHLGNVLRDLPDTTRFLAHWLRYRTLASRKFPSIIVTPDDRRFSLDFHAEQVPNPDSRVTLGTQTDALGMRRLHIDWHYSAQDIQTVTCALNALAQDLQTSGTGRFDFVPEEIETEMTRYGAYGGHHLGTARMGTDVHTSVVDADCRVHEASNLYVAGAAVFPTSSQANPTLTIVALALRLADHLRARYAKPDHAVDSLQPTDCA